LDRFEVLVIGAGQAGLAVGHYLAQQGRRLLIVDGAAAVGDSWRRRWDSLRLFTPARYNGLPGMPFPGPPDYMPGKDEVADYLASYATRWQLPLRMNTRVLSVRRPHGSTSFIIETSRGAIAADRVVLATGPFHRPRIPLLAAGLNPQVVQFHSSGYRGPAQLPLHGDVMVVGGGNSGVQIASEVAQQRRTWLSIGTRLPRLPQHVLGHSLFRLLDLSGLMNVTVNSRLGRRMRSREFLLGDAPEDLARRYGVQLTGRTEAAEGLVLRTATHRVTVSAVIWATGSSADFSLLDPAWLGPDGQPRHQRGVTDTTGLYLLGLPWLHTRGSALLGWVYSDAAHVAGHIRTSRAMRTGRPPQRQAGRHAKAPPA
jgi:putative flavoprotein involved in K+ transport